MRAESIGRQVNALLKNYNGIGESKRDAREASGRKSESSGHKVSDKFHSGKSMDNARSDLTNLGKFVKAEYGIKEISKIEAEHVRAWLNSREITYDTASNNLSNIIKVSPSLRVTEKELKGIRAEVKESFTNKEQVSRAYKGLDKIEVHERSQPGFELQRDHGLRQGAATHINLKEQLKGNTLSYREKGGKWSSKEISNQLKAKLEDQAKNGIYKVPQTTYGNHVGNAIRATGQEYNGSHGIRHTYAQNRIASGSSKEEVSKELGHVRAEITNTYLR